MRRRDFIKGVAGSATVWPLAARAQQGKLPTIGFVVATSRRSRWTTAFVQRLRDLGWTEGRTVAIEYRFAEGRNESFGEIAAEFVRLKVDVIVTPGGGTLAMKQATSTIPIVFTAANDPVGSGLVARLARPGGNVTGLSNQNADVAGKRLELLREIVPGLHRLAILTNAGYAGSQMVVEQTKAAAHTLALDVPHSKSGKRPISYPPLKHLKIAQTPSMSSPTRWSIPTEYASIFWRPQHDCRRATGFGSWSKMEV
jgi:putative tryptophan/tyrosine transport system substrate-binding protein